MTIGDTAEIENRRTDTPEEIPTTAPACGTATSGMATVETALLPERRVKTTRRPLRRPTIPIQRIPIRMDPGVMLALANRKPTDQRMDPMDQTRTARKRLIRTQRAQDLMALPTPTVPVLTDTARQQTMKTMTTANTDPKAIRQRLEVRNRNGRRAGPETTPAAGRIRPPVHGAMIATKSRPDLVMAPAAAR